MEDNMKPIDRIDNLEEEAKDDLQDFVIQVSASRDFEPIKTGINTIDKAIGGGLIRKTLVMLGSAPGMGKTALAQWICENMARDGHNVLYLNLEMDRAQLLARSISRIAYSRLGHDLSVLDIMRAYDMTDEQEKVFDDAIRIYRREISKNFRYNPEGVTNHIDSIIDCMNESIRFAKYSDKAPIVCIDYLQLIDSGERDAVEGMKQVIYKLKSFAKENDTIVFVIMANNRSSNRAGIAELESGRDTSAIEYSGDLIFGLTYTAIDDRRQYQDGTDRNGNPKMFDYDIDTIRRLKKEAFDNGDDIPRVCQELSLKVLKNRFVDSERTARLIFDGKHARFTEAINEESEWVSYSK